MICVKFGGTCVTPRNLCYVADMVDKNVGCVVVSAVGREFIGDEKMTDLLEKYYVSRDESVWNGIVGKMKRLCEVNGINVDIEKLLFVARKQISKNDKNYCLSIGEELAARCVAAFLSVPYIDAAEYVRFKNGRFDEEKTKCRIRNLVGQRFVVGGFYGGENSLRMLFSRGGGDVTGAVFSVFTDSVLYKNVTDVDGIYVADPSKVPQTRILSEISYKQMELLSYCGASVLHTDAVRLPSKYGVPVVVCGMFGGTDSGTTISYCPCLSSTVGVTQKYVNGSFETTLIHNMTLQQISEKLAKQKLLANNVDKIVLGCNVLRTKGKKDVLRLMYDTFI